MPNCQLGEGSSSSTALELLILIAGCDRCQVTRCQRVSKPVLPRIVPSGFNSISDLTARNASLSSNPFLRLPQQHFLTPTGQQFPSPVLSPGAGLPHVLNRHRRRSPRISEGKNDVDHPTPPSSTSWEAVAYRIPLELPRTAPHRAPPTESAVTPTSVPFTFLHNARC